MIASASNTSVTAKITDSRGQTATASVTIAIYDYTSPQINSFSVHRCNSDGTLNNNGAYMRVDYKVTVTALGNNNTKSLTIKYKKVSASSYTSQSVTLSSYTQTGEVHNIAADVNSSYNVQLVLADYFTSTTSTLTLPTASTRINWKSGENGGIAFGKVSEYDKTFEIADDWTIKFGPNAISDLGFESSSNYLKLPDGTLIQWGEATIPSGSAKTTVTFPLAFANVNYAFFPTGIYTYTRDISFVYAAQTATTIDIWHGSADLSHNVYFKWLTIGRWK